MRSIKWDGRGNAPTETIFLSLFLLPSSFPLRSRCWNQYKWTQSSSRLPGYSAHPPTPRSSRPEILFINVCGTSQPLVVDRLGLQGVVLKLPLRGWWTGVLDHAPSRGRIDHWGPLFTPDSQIPTWPMSGSTRAAAAAAAWSSRFRVLQVSLSEYKSPFWGNSGWRWQQCLRGYFVPVEACQLVEVFETGLKLL